MTTFPGTRTGVCEQKFEGRISPVQKALPTVEELVRLLAVRQPQPYAVLRAVSEAVARLEKRRKAERCAIAAPLRGDRFNYSQDVRVAVTPGQPANGFAADGSSPKSVFAEGVSVTVFAEVVYTDANKQKPCVLAITVDAVALESDVEETD